MFAEHPHLVAGFFTGGCNVSSLSMSHHQLLKEETLGDVSFPQETFRGEKSCLLPPFSAFPH